VRCICSIVLSSVPAPQGGSVGVNPVYIVRLCVCSGPLVEHARSAEEHPINPLLARAPLCGPSPAGRDLRYRGGSHAPPGPGRPTTGAVPA
jgi:hypothetical protein